MHDAVQRPLGQCMMLLEGHWVSDDDERPLCWPAITINAGLTLFSKHSRVQASLRKGLTEGKGSD